MIVGVTGGIGSGKSTVVSLFKQWGAWVIDVDKIGWEVLESKQQEVISAFGKEVLKEDKIDRKELGELIFRYPEKKKILDSIVHPSLIQELKKRINAPCTLHSAPCTLVVDCALIYEWGIESWFDKVILVTSNYKNKLHRLLNLGYTKEEAENRIRAQLPDETKSSDWVLKNDSNLKSLEKNARKIWNKITES